MRVEQVGRSGCNLRSSPEPEICRGDWGGARGNERVSFGSKVNTKGRRNILTLIYRNEGNFRGKCTVFLANPQREDRVSTERIYTTPATQISPFYTPKPIAFWGSVNDEETGNQPPETPSLSLCSDRCMRNANPKLTAADSLDLQKPLHKTDCPILFRRFVHFHQR